MVDDEKLSQADADSAAGVDMASRLADTYQGTGDDYRYPSYFDAVIEEATKTYGLSEDEIVKNGYKIYTEMDANSQAPCQSRCKSLTLARVRPALHPLSPNGFRIRLSGVGRCKR